MPETYSFAIYPANFDGAFEAFILDVPSTLGQDAAARRAYFSAMARLAGMGFDVEDFLVAVWDNDNNAPGALVGAGGIEGSADA